MSDARRTRTEPAFKIRFRVIATVKHRVSKNGPVKAVEKMLFTGPDYAMAEAFCNCYIGDAIQLEIKKVWA